MTPNKDAIEKAISVLNQHDRWHAEKSPDGYYYNTSIHRDTVEALQLLREHQSKQAEGEIIIPGTGLSCARNFFTEAVDGDGTPVVIITKWYWDEVMKLLDLFDPEQSERQALTQGDGG